METVWPPWADYFVYTTYCSLRIFVIRLSATMSIRASCFAAFGVLLCLNLVSGWMGVDYALPTGPAHSSPSGRSWDDIWPKWRFSGSNRASENSRTFGGRSASDKEEEIMDAEDLVLTATQYRRLYQGVMGRSAGRTAATPWTDGVIPYEISPGIFTQNQVDWIERAMRVWEKETCVRFRKALSTDRNRVIIKKVRGCYARLGMIGETQDISLVDSCFFRGAVEHELGHTMGLIHEHQRPNRDDYVKINYFAVQRDMIFQINKYAKNSDDKYGLPYDYHSVMHYEKYAFSKDRRVDQTIYPKDNSKTDVIGMVMGPSFYDIKLINLMYNCKARCTNPPACQEPCFVNEKCQCYCKSDAPKEVCQDALQTCAYSAKQGDCQRKAFTMLNSCRRSCGLCTVDGSVPQLPCGDISPFCFDTSCNDPSTSKLCKKTCNLCGDNSIQPPCRDNLKDCKQRAEKDECESNAEMMLKQCAKSCNFCSGRKQPPPRACDDEDTMCVYQKSLNACNDFKAKMSQVCKRTCNNCDNHVVVPASCVDQSPHCFSLAWQNDCHKAYGRCQISCNECALDGGQNGGLGGGDACRDMAENYCLSKGPEACFSVIDMQLCKRMCGLC